MDPKKIAAMDFGRFFQLVTTRERGLAQQRRLKAIWEVAAASIGCAVDRASQFEAQVLVEKILQVQKEIKDTQQLIETISQQFKEYHLLLTIPGFGSYVASLVLAVIGDAWRFGRQNKF